MKTSFTLCAVRAVLAVVLLSLGATSLAAQDVVGCSPGSFSLPFSTAGWGQALAIDAIAALPTPLPRPEAKILLSAIARSYGQIGRSLVEARTNYLEGRDSAYLTHLDLALGYAADNQRRIFEDLATLPIPVPHPEALKQGLVSANSALIQQIALLPTPLP